MGPPLERAVQAASNKVETLLSHAVSVRGRVTGKCHFWVGTEGVGRQWCRGSTGGVSSAVVILAGK